jgi:dihydrolipoamide dehydrogenase
VTLVSSRDQVLPGKDSDAAKVVQDVFANRGMRVVSQSRAIQVTRSDSGVEVELESGEVIAGSHCLMAVGSLPNTEAIGLEKVGVKTNDAGFIDVDKVSRTSVRGVYAAGDCTGVMMLASVAAMQGRIAMWHALGDAVHPLNLETVSSNVFTDPEIATVGVSQSDLDSGIEIANVVNLPLATNARAKMQGISEGFVKIFSRPDTGVIVGGVVVAPKASELIFPIALAIEHRLTVDQMSQTITVYPSLSGSIAEAARQLHQTQNLS